jgi:hypothetical protein
LLPAQKASILFNIGKFLIGLTGRSRGAAAFAAAIISLTFVGIDRSPTHRIVV